MKKKYIYIYIYIYCFNLAVTGIYIFFVSISLLLLVYIYILFQSRCYYWYPVSGQAVVTGVFPSPLRWVPSLFFAHGIQHPNCSSIIVVNLLHSRPRAFHESHKKSVIVRIRRGSNSRNWRYSLRGFTYQTTGDVGYIVGVAVGAIAFFSRSIDPVVDADLEAAHGRVRRRRWVFWGTQRTGYRSPYTHEKRKRVIFAKFDGNRRAVAMLNPLRDKYECTFSMYQGGGRDGTCDHGLTCPAEIYIYANVTRRTKTVLLNLARGPGPASASLNARLDRRTPIYYRVTE